MYLLCGLPGSGKTTFARRLEAGGATRLSIDELVFDRHGVYGVDYDPAVYHELHDAARAELDNRLVELLADRLSVVLDYGFWTKELRDRYKRLADDAGAAWELIFFPATADLLLERLERRKGAPGPNGVPIDEAMLADFLAQFEPPDGEGEKVVEPALRSWQWPPSREEPSPRNRG